MQVLKLLFFFALFFFQFEVIAIEPQSVPGVINFTKNNYRAGSQNWNIAQDCNGILYFANGEGLLEYDGSRWLLHRMPNKMGLHSVAIDSNNRIYTGAYEEFGFWETNPNGNLLYYSLTNLLGDYNFNDAEIWRILIHNDKVYFQSFGAYFVYDGKSVIPYQTPGAILFFLRAGNNIYTQGINAGLFQLTNDTLTQLPNSDIFKNDLIYATLPIGSNRIVLGTASHGLYYYDIDQNKFTSWKTEADDILTTGQVNCGVIVSDSILCFGTIGSGVVAINLRGEILWHFYKDHSLVTNTVLNIFQDNQSNIWLALDRGIALVQNNSVLHFTPFKTAKIELIYTAVQYKNSIYLGTNQGLYQLKVIDQENRLSFVPETLGQVWQLSVIDDQVLCGHNNGTYRVKNNKAIKISSLTGGTSLKQINDGNKEYLIQGTYTSLALYSKNTQGNWIFSREIRGFSHPIRFLETDHLGYIWASHAVKGLYRIKLNNDMTEASEIKLYGITNEPLGDSKINVFKVNNRIVFCSGEMIYTYDDLNDKIVAYEWLNKELGEFASSHLIIPVSKDRYWFINENKYGLFKITKTDVELIDVVPFSSLYYNLIDNYEFVAALDSNKFLFCLENGLAVYDQDTRNNLKRNNPSIIFRQIRAISDKESILLPLKSDEKEMVEIPYSFRQLIFSIAYPDFGTKKMRFYYILSDSEEIPMTDPELVKTFTNLAPGKYTLKFVAKDEINGTLTTSKYFFRISPPWYASVTAYTIYVVTFLLILYIIWRSVKIHYRKQHEKIIEEQAQIQQERIERREQKIMTLKNEKLQAGLIHKSKELASATMSIIRKNDMLIMLKDEVESQKQKLGTQYPNKYADKLIRLINENISSEDDWQIFQHNFDMIHENFFRHIKKQYPELTVYDLKLCAYLRLNLTTKEIASLLNISIRGVESARHRLRKKFYLLASKNLNEFLIEFK